MNGVIKHECENSIEDDADSAFNLLMLRLLLLRHAKAVPENAQDHNRALALRGRTNASALGLYAREQHLLPDLVITSDALRTLETAMLVVRALNDNIPLQRDAKLYLAEVPALLNVIRHIPDEVNTCLMVGHNPGFHDLAQLLVGYGDRYAAARLRAGMPTCALAILDFDCDTWSDITAHKGRLDRFIIPDDLNTTTPD